MIWAYIAGGVGIMSFVCLCVYGLGYDRGYERAVEDTRKWRTKLLVRSG